MKDPHSTLSSTAQLQQNTFHFYETQAAALIENTKNPNGAAWYAHLIDLLAPQAHILDAGCGAGYASQYFLQHGFAVTAFDASKPLVEFASQLIQQPVHHLTFENLTFEDQFDGIWACASLLHVPRQDISCVIHKLAAALKGQGVLYMNFVYGTQETARGGLLFNDYNETDFGAVLSKEPTLQVMRMWKSPDLPPVRSERAWLHILAQKIP